MNLTSYWFGWCSALLMGVSKTGLPGLSIPSILLMTEAFPDDARLAIGAMLPVLLVGDCFAVAWYRHHAQWDRLWGLFPYVAVGMIPGWIVLRVLPDGNGLRPIIGTLFLALLTVEICRRWFAWEHVPNKRWFIALIGLLAGFATIIAHAAFAVMAIYLLSQGMAKKEFMGTAAWFYFIINFSKIPFYAAAGMMTQATLPWGCLSDC